MFFKYERVLEVGPRENTQPTLIFPRHNVWKVVSGDDCLADSTDNVKQFSTNCSQFDYMRAALLPASQGFINPFAAGRPILVQFLQTIKHTKTGPTAASSSLTKLNFLLGNESRPRRVSVEAMHLLDVRCGLYSAASRLLSIVLSQPCHSLAYPLYTRLRSGYA